MNDFAKPLGVALIVVAAIATALWFSGRGEPSRRSLARLAAGTIVVILVFLAALVAVSVAAPLP